MIEQLEKLIKEWESTRQSYENDSSVVYGAAEIVYRHCIGDIKDLIKMSQPHNPSLKADKLPPCSNCKEPRHHLSTCCPACGYMYPLAP